MHHAGASPEKQSVDGFQSAPKDTGDLLDLSYLDMISGGNSELKRKIIQMLIDETPDELYNLKQFTREKNWKRVRAVSHKMKAGLTYLGLTHALEWAKRIEENAGTETHLDRIPDLVERVTVACTKAINDLVKSRMDKQLKVEG